MNVFILLLVITIQPKLTSFNGDTENLHNNNNNNNYNNNNNNNYYTMYFEYTDLAVNLIGIFAMTSPCSPRCVSIT